MALQVQDFVDLLKPIVEDARELATDDGKFSFADLLKVTPSAVKAFMEIASDVKEATGEEKKQFVIEAFQWTYRELDPDIPWLPDFIENPLEEYLLDSLVPGLIEALYEEMKERLAKKEETEE